MELWTTLKMIKNMNILHLYDKEDIIFIETCFEELGIAKFASDSIVGTIGNYLMNEIKSVWNAVKDDPIPALLNLAAPILLKKLFGGGIGTIAGLAYVILEQVFHVNFTSLFAALRDKIFGLVKTDSEGNKTVDPNTLNQTITSEVQNNINPDNLGQEEQEKLLEALKEHKGSINKGGSGKASILKLSEVQNELVKYAALSTGLKAALSGGIGGFIIRVLKTIFTTILIGAGVKVGAGAVAHGLGIHHEQTGAKEINLGKMTGLTKSKPKYELKEGPKANNHSQFISNDSFHMWIMKDISLSQLPDLLVKWTTDIYPELEGHEDLIKSAPGFQETVRKIKERNKTDILSNSLIMPAKIGDENINSEKAVVDCYYDDLANAYADKVLKKKNN